MEVFKQAQYNPIPGEVPVAVLWAVQNGYVDQVPVERVKQFQEQFTDFLTTRRSDLIITIGREKLLNDTVKAELKAAADEFSQIWKAVPVR
jgi:F-type H+-transporting ATPase subunit alpha